MDEAGCGFGALILVIAMAGLYGIYLAITDYLAIFLIVGGSLAALITFFTLRISRKKKQLKEANEATQAIADMEYADSPEGKLDQAIEKCIAQKQEQIQHKAELEGLLKYNLDKIYKRHKLPQTDEATLLLHYKGRQSTREEQTQFQELYGKVIENEIRQRSTDNPTAEHFTIRNQVNNEFKELYFKPSYYYADDFKEGLLEETILEVQGVIDDLKGQQEVCDTIIEYYTKVEKQFRETRENYKAKIGLSTAQESLERISEQSFVAKEELKMAQEEAAYEAQVFTELQKLTAEFEGGLSGTLQGMVKEDLLKINEGFKQDLS
ncbi:MAG: hypothetical protein ACPGJS_08885 [Flammeovirgaceae bacterium]